MYGHKKSAFYKNAVANGSIIRTDDPEAINKLNERITVLEKTYALHKAENEKAKRENLPLPHPYMINDYQDIRRNKQRLNALIALNNRVKTVYDLTDTPVTKIEEDDTVKDIRVYIEPKRSREFYHFMRQRGFVYSDMNQCYQRQLSDTAIYKCKRLLTEMRTLSHQTEATM